MPRRFIDISHPAAVRSPPSAVGRLPTRRSHRKSTVIVRRRAIAKALTSYLRGGRPAHAPTRHLFVGMKGPHRPLSGSSPVRHRLIEHARRAGVSAPYLDAHVLRHAHAFRQMELGTSPKLIGDILGHRDPESTSAYLRVSTQRLREMALAVPS
ncbi:MAG: tyrosine-type recombinase/integrase [Panacagrimonas sp.]